MKVQIKQREKKYYHPANSPIKDLQIIFSEDLTNSIRVAHPEDAIVFLRLKKIREWKAEQSISFVTGYIRINCDKAVISLPAKWEKDLCWYYERKIDDLISMLFDGTHLDE